MAEEREVSEDELFDDIYNFDHRIAEWLVPRLKYFLEKTDSTPAKRDENFSRVVDKDGEIVFLEMDEWKSIIQQIIDGFQKYLDDNYTISDIDSVKKSLDLLSIYFFDLWI